MTIESTKPPPDFLTLVPGTNYCYSKQEFDPKIYAACNYVGNRTLIKCRNVRTREQLSKNNGICEEHTLFAAHLRSLHDSENRRMIYDGKRKKYEPVVRYNEEVCEEDPILTPLHMWKCSAEDTVPYVEYDHPLKNAGAFTEKEVLRMRKDAVSAVIESIRMQREIIEEQARRCYSQMHDRLEEDKNNAKMMIKLDEKQKRLLKTSNRLFEVSRTRNRIEETRQRLQEFMPPYCAFGRIHSRKSSPPPTKKSLSNEELMANLRVKEEVISEEDQVLNTVTFLLDSVDPNAEIKIEEESSFFQSSASEDEDDRMEIDLKEEESELESELDESIVCCNPQLPQSIFCLKHIHFDPYQKIYTTCEVCNETTVDYGDRKCDLHRKVRRCVTPPLVLGPLSVQTGPPEVSSGRESKQHSSRRLLDKQREKEAREDPENERDDSLDGPIRHVIIDSDSESFGTPSPMPSPDDVASTSTAHAPQFSLHGRPASQTQYKPVARELHANEEILLRQEERLMVCAKTRPFKPEFFNRRAKPTAFPGTVRTRKPVDEKPKPAARGRKSQTSARGGFFSAGSAYQPRAPTTTPAQLTEDQAAAAGLEAELGLLEDRPPSPPPVTEDLSQFQRVHPTQRGRGARGRTPTMNMARPQPATPAGGPVRAVVGSGVRVAVRGAMAGGTAVHRMDATPVPTPVSGFRGLTMPRSLPQPPHRKSAGGELLHNTPQPVRDVHSGPQGHHPDSRRNSAEQLTANLTNAPPALTQSQVAYQPGTSQRQGTHPQLQQGAPQPSLKVGSVPHGIHPHPAQGAVTQQQYVQPAHQAAMQRAKQQTASPIRYVVATAAQREAAGFSGGRTQTRGSPAHPSTTPGHQVITPLTTSSQIAPGGSSQRWVSTTARGVPTQNRSAVTKQGMQITPLVSVRPSISGGQPPRPPPQMPGQKNWSQTANRVTTLSTRPAIVPPHRLVQQKHSMVSRPPAPIQPVSKTTSEVKPNSSAPRGNPADSHTSQAGSALEDKSAPITKENSPRKEEKETDSHQPLILPPPPPAPEMDALSLLASAALSQSTDKTGKANDAHIGEAPMEKDKPMNITTPKPTMPVLTPEERAAQQAAAQAALDEDDFDEEL